MKQRERGSSNRRSELVCAACRYQRKRCPPDCPLAPFFPPSSENDFQNVRRLFGISNILKLISNLDPSHRHIAMKSIIFHAKKRALDPVGGCHRIILHLQLLIQSYTAQLHLVLQKLHQCRQQGAFPPQNHDHGQSTILATLPHDLQQHTTTSLLYNLLQPAQDSVVYDGKAEDGVTLPCKTLEPVEKHTQHIQLLDNYCPGKDVYSAHDDWPVGVNVKLESTEKATTSSTQCLLQTLIHAACNIDAFDKKVEAPLVALDSTEIVQHSDETASAEDVIATLHEPEPELENVEER
ncbi:hypothetical protein FNV43_RR12722 [Rhamnella rubrinervis]|uniref:LOB domain-containing protein n=1 Tax=Rhamnella rubrinervis TaxID=2594499 RepID=A0A8K0H868_9ROSA|nr:hypothetical protein FNV43_RR12722 [Rhamnella rubrinervis]